MNKYALILNCIKNAQKAGHNFVVCSYSKNLYYILNIFFEKSFIKGFFKKNMFRKKLFIILLKYKNDKPVINEFFIKKIRTFFEKKPDLFSYNGLGQTLVSNLTGTTTREIAFLSNIGGSLLFSVK
jgi:ribosomal protein S8